jgi:hypothetical protein
MFWALWAKAESEELPVSATRFERDALRRSVIMKACHVKSLTEVGQTSDFDKLMMEVATLACDYEAMAHFCVSSERRTCFLIRECARQIGEIAGVPHGWDYCVKVFEQSRLPSSWEDTPEYLLFATFQMLDIHRRRMLKRDYGWSGARQGQPLGFNAGRSYMRSGLCLLYQDGPPVDIAASA